MCIHLILLLRLQCSKHSFLLEHIMCTPACLQPACAASAHICSVSELKLYFPVVLQAQPQLPATEVAMPFVISSW